MHPTTTTTGPPCGDDPAPRPAIRVRLSAGRLAATRSNERWAATVLVSGVATGVLDAVGLPGPLAVALGLAWAIVGIADLVAALVMERVGRVGRGLAAYERQLEQIIVDQLIDGPTHGWLSDAEEALTSVQARLLPRVEGTDPNVRAIASALTDIRTIETRLRGSHARRRAWSGRLPASVSGGYAAAELAEESAVHIRLYGDPAYMSGRFGPRTRDVLVRIGAVLDDVRMVNTVQIEWAVLLFTLWARALIVGGAPLLASVSFGDPPLQGGWSAGDLPWMLVAAWAAASAICAPWIATNVMLRDARGATVRRWLLIAEVPLAAAAILCAPCWAVAVFAVGWSNWWQRPDFVWVRLWLWMGAVLGLLAAGMAIAGAQAGEVGLEYVIAMTVTAIIGATYGAMLPVSLSILLRTLIGGLLTSHRAHDRADVQISESIRHLLGAARAIEQGAPDDPLAARDVRTLRDCAEALGRRADAGDRWARRTPLRLKNLIDTTLEDAGPMSGRPTATLLLEEAILSKSPEPVTLEDAAFHQRRLRRARFRKRRAAAALRLLVTEAVREARRHGTGPLVTMCRLEGDRVILRFANVARPGPARKGRGNGDSNLRRLAKALPDGRIDVRGTVDGSFIDLPPASKRFGVQASFDAGALDDVEDNHR